MPDEKFITVEELTNLVQNRTEYIHGRSTRHLVDQMGGIHFIASKLRTDLHNGISIEDIPNRIHLYGNNKEHQGLFMFPWKDFVEGKFVFVFVASIISVILGATLSHGSESITWVEGICVIFTVSILYFIRFIIAFRLQTLQNYDYISHQRKTTVIRNGKQFSVLITDILLGDIIILQARDYVPADCLFLSGSHCSVDESSLTGESAPARKDEDDPFLLASQMVVDGEAKCMVICVGVNTQWGQIKASLECFFEPTPEQEKLDAKSAKYGARAAVLVFLGLTIMWSVQHFALQGHSWQWSHIEILLRFFITSLCIWILAEGLPIAYTFLLCQTVERMRQDNIVVRCIDACEKLAQVTCICTEATGILTLNQLEVVRMWLGGLEFTELPLKKDLVAAEYHEILHESIGVNTSAELDTSDPENYHLVGSSVECALLELSRIHEVDFRQYRGHNVVRTLPFSAQTKRNSTGINKGAFNRLYCKGRAEQMLSVCDRMLLPNGTISTLDKKLVEEEISKWHELGMRTVALAYTDDLDSDFATAESSDLVKNLTLIAVLGMEYPVKPDVAQSVSACKRAAIEVKLLTGASTIAAKQVAKKCNILDEHGIALEGPSIARMTDEEFQEIARKLSVISRSYSATKYAVVDKLQQLGEFVAVTGDGCGDGPVLKRATVGISLNKQGTEVSKSASHLIILDDNFSTIEKAIEWGRHVAVRSQQIEKMFLAAGIAAVMLLFGHEILTEGIFLAPVYVLGVALLLQGIAAWLASSLSKTDHQLTS